MGTPEGAMGDGGAAMAADESDDAKLEELMARMRPAAAH
jgi:hypothetical protein